MYGSKRRVDTMVAPNVCFAKVGVYTHALRPHCEVVRSSGKVEHVRCRCVGSHEYLAKLEAASIDWLKQVEAE